MKSWKTIESVFLMSAIFGLICGCSDKGSNAKEGSASSNGYEVKYRFERGGRELARLKEQVKAAESSLEHMKQMKQDFPQIDLKGAELELEQAQQKLKLGEPSFLAQKKWLLWIEVTTKKVGPLGVYLATRDGGKISFALISSKGSKVIGDNNTYIASPFEIEDLENNKFQISQGMGAIAGGSTQLVRLENGTILLVVEHADAPFNPTEIVCKIVIKLPPQSN